MAASDPSGTLLQAQPAAAPLRAPGLAERAAAEIRQRGYCELASCFSPAEVDQAREQAAATLVHRGSNYAAVRGNRHFTGAILHDLAESAAFKALCAALYAELYGRPAPPILFDQLLRCLTDRSAPGHSYYFHYDSFALTAIVPLAMPAADTTGDLILFPDRRPLRRTYLGNMVDKARADRAISQRRWREELDTTTGAERIRLVPGNIYLFLGYRSLHANEPCGPGSSRTTLVLHCIDPHASSPMKRLLALLRRHP